MPQMQEVNLQDVKVDFYLSDAGKEITIHEFQYQNKDWHSVLFSVYLGLASLNVAVLTTSARRFAQIDVTEASNMLKAWGEQTGRADLVGDLAQCNIERMPGELPGYRFEDKHADLHIYEGDTAFWIEHVPSKEEACMGDGVDSDFYPGMLKAEYSMLMEAYFPDIAEEEDKEEVITCDSCNLTYAAAGGLGSGIFHEKGCRNDGKDWVSGRRWVRFIECRECGDRVEEGEPCSCNEQDSE